MTRDEVLSENTLDVLKQTHKALSTARRWFHSNEIKCEECGFNNILGWNCQVKDCGLFVGLRCGNCFQTSIPDQTIPKKELGIEPIAVWYT